VTALCLVFYPGTGTAQIENAMRDYDEEDPKKPRPVSLAKKGCNTWEAAEAYPWRMTRQDIDADRHRHVV